MSGDGDDYTPDEVDEVYDALSEAFAGHAAGGPGGGEITGAITATAKVEWAGEYANNGRDGQRTVHLNPVNLTAVRDAVNKAQRLEGLAGRGPLRSYKARGWQAQLKQLSGTKRGREALQAAGWSPSRETLRRYNHGTQAPSKANRARITDAYDSARNPGRGWAEARREAADALTAALRQEYGSNVRFRDIADLRIE